MRFLRLLISMLACLPVMALEIGQQAPRLDEVAWLGRTPVPNSETRLQLLVLWSPADPLYRSVLPCMTDLARRHGEVQILGLSSADSGSLSRIARNLGTKVGIPLGHLDSLQTLMPPVGLPCAVLLDPHGTGRWWGFPLAAPGPVVDALAGSLHVVIPADPAGRPVGMLSPSQAGSDAMAGPVQTPAPPMREERDPDQEPAPERGPTTQVIIESDPWWAWGVAPIGGGWFLPLPPLLPGPWWHGHGHAGGYRGPIGIRR